MRHTVTKAVTRQKYTYSNNQIYNITDLHYSIFGNFEIIFSFPRKDMTTYLATAKTSPHNQRKYFHSKINLLKVFSQKTSS